MRRSGDYVDSGEGWARPAGRGKAFVWLIRTALKDAATVIRTRASRKAVLTSERIEVESHVVEPTATRPNVAATRRSVARLSVTRP